MGLNVTYSTIVLSVSQYNKQSQKKITSEAFLTFIKHVLIAILLHKRTLQIFNYFSVVSTLAKTRSNTGD